MQSNSGTLATTAINQTALNLIPNIQQSLHNNNLINYERKESTNLLQIVQAKDTTFTKIFVGGLPYHTTDETLKNYFKQFGNIEEAVVIIDRTTGKSRGYGFVTMETKEQAAAAIHDPNPVIDGRKCNLNLAYLGVKQKILPQTANFIPLTIRYPISTDTTSTYGLHPIYYQTLAAASQSVAPQVLAAPQNMFLPSQSAVNSTSLSPLNTLSGLESYNNQLNSIINANRTSPFDACNHLTLPYAHQSSFLQYPNQTNLSNQIALNSMLANPQTGGNYL